MTTENFFNFFRSTLYLLISLQFILISNFYFQVRRQTVKKNKILDNIVNLFFWLGIFFFGLFLVPILRIFSLDSYLFITRHLYVFTVPVLFYAIRTWKSLWDDEKKDDGKNRKKTLQIKIYKK
ncbi:MAG: hypothetical protein KatS3mg090_1022 [Patescibacteria group bacterium]|nr:MAG: hypothetical protein KatS3mg090_1022 [Patescibacteria group bacterium]